MSAEKLPVSSEKLNISQPLKLSDLCNTSIQAILEITEKKSIPKKEPTQ